MWFVLGTFVAIVVCLTLAAGVAKSRPNIQRLAKRDPEAAERLAQQLVDEQRYGKSIGSQPSAVARRRGGQRF